MDNINGQKKQFDYWKQIILLLGAGWVVMWIYRNTLPSLFQEMQGTIGQHSDSQMGLILSFYYFGYTVIQIPSGILVDKFGKKIIMIPGYTLFALASILIGSTSSITMMFVGSFIAGAGCGSYYGASYALSAEFIPSERKTISNAIINSGVSIGMIIGLIATSYFVKTAGVQWNYMMYAVAILILLVTVAFGVFIKETRKQTDKEAESKTISKGSIKDLFTSKMVAAYIVYFVTCYAHYGLVTWLPSFLENERGLGGLLLGYTSSLLAVSSIPGSLFFSRISDKFRNKKVSILIFLELSAATMITLLVLVPTSTTLFIVLTLYGFLGKLAIDPIIITYISDSATKGKVGTFLGVFNFFGMSGAVISPVVTGFISDKTGSKAFGFYTSAILLVIGATVFFFTNLKKESKS
jgi:MFS family permease